jgi:hypothetical protein
MIEWKPFEESVYATFSMVDVPIKCVKIINENHPDITHIMFVSESCLPTVSGNFFINTIQKVVPNNSWISLPDTYDERCEQYKRMLQHKINPETLKKFFDYHDIKFPGKLDEIISNRIKQLEAYHPIISRQQSLWYNDHMKYFSQYYDLFTYLHNKQDSQIRGSDEVFIGNFINVISIILTGSPQKFYWTKWSITDADFINYNYFCNAHRSSPYVFDFKDNVNIYDTIMEDVGFRKLQGILCMIKYLDVFNNCTNIYKSENIQQMIRAIYNGMKMNYDQSVVPFLEIPDIMGKLEYCYERIKYFDSNTQNAFMTKFSNYDDRCSVLKSIMIYLPDENLEKLIAYYIGCDMDMTQFENKLNESYVYGYKSIISDAKPISLKCHNELLLLIKEFKNPLLKCLLVHLLGFRVGSDDARYIKSQLVKRKTTDTPIVDDKPSKKKL